MTTMITLGKNITIYNSSIELRMTGSIKSKQIAWDFLTSHTIGLSYRNFNSKVLRPVIRCWFPRGTCWIGSTMMTKLERPLNDLGDSGLP